MCLTYIVTESPLAWGLRWVLLHKPQMITVRSVEIRGHTVFPEIFLVFWWFYFSKKKKYSFRVHFVQHVYWKWQRYVFKPIKHILSKALDCKQKWHQCWMLGMQRWIQHGTWLLWAELCLHRPLPPNICSSPNPWYFWMYPYLEIEAKQM